MSHRFKIYLTNPDPKQTFLALPLTNPFFNAVVVYKGAPFIYFKLRPSLLSVALKNELKVRHYDFVFYLKILNGKIQILYGWYK